MSISFIRPAQSAVSFIRKFWWYSVDKVSYAWSAIIVSLALGADTLMHVLNVPHIEGWWIPVVSGSSAFAGLRVWFRRKRS